MHCTRVDLNHLTLMVQLLTEKVIMRFWVLLSLLLIPLLASGRFAYATEWQVLEPGLDLRWFVARTATPVGDSRITVLRIDPVRWQLEYRGRQQTPDRFRGSARDWVKREGFAAAINAGMFLEDHATHLGYTEFRGQIISGNTNAYQSVAAFDPRTGSLPPFRFFDLDDPGVRIDSIRRDYASLIQNLRLIRRPGANRWGQQPKKWSEAALAEDSEGRILFVFSRSPFSMHDFNRELLSSGIAVVAAQHLEGGPEAQLYVNVGGTEVEMFGSYETGFNENDVNAVAWPIPNVLGIKRRDRKP